MRSPSVALALVAIIGLVLGVDAASTGTGSTILYVVIGIVAVLLLLSAFLLWRCLRNRARKRQEQDMAGPPPPLSATYGFHLETGRPDEPAAVERPRDQPRQHHPHKHQNQTAPPRSGYEQPQRTPPSGQSPYEIARPMDEPQPAQLYNTLEMPFDGPSSFSPAAAAAAAPAPRPSAGHQHNGNGHDQLHQQPGHHQHVRKPPLHRQERTERVEAADRDHDHAAHAATDDQEAASVSATQDSQVARSHVLSLFETDPVLQQCRIPESSLFFTRLLSKGAFGEVWLAHLETRKVAAKRILKEKRSDVREIESFVAEIRLMASFSHPKIVEFVGVSWTTIEDVCAVTEYMGRGDLYNFLKVHVGKLNWRDHKIFLAEDVADALGYLHGLAPKVIHRDLKSKNVLLDDVFRAKLSDFGISRERSVEDTMTAGVGTIYWTAPEVLMGKKYTEKADIYSFGIVMSELDTQKVPYSDKRDEAGKKLQGMKVLQVVIQQAMRPTLSRDCPLQVRQLIGRCVSADPDARPDAAELLSLIRVIEDDLE